MKRQPQPEPTKLVGPEVIARLLGVSRNTVLNWSNKGDIPAIKIRGTYRFSLELVSKSIGYELSVVYM
jgi:excisionase family DNA binding protein